MKPFFKKKNQHQVMKSKMKISKKQNVNLRPKLFDWKHQTLRKPKKLELQ
jgi:hypothetical protein